MRIKDANNLAAGATVRWHDMIGLLDYQANVTAIVPFQHVTVAIPHVVAPKPNSQTYPLGWGTDGQMEIPIFALI